MAVPPAIAEIAASTRAANTRRITTALAVSTAAAVPIFAAIGIKTGVLVLLAFMAIAQGVARLLVDRRGTTVAVFLSSACLIVQHIVAVVIQGRLGPAPYSVPLLILLVAATADSRWLPVSFVACLALLGIDAYLSPWRWEDRNSIAVSTLFAALAFVVSMLHVRGTERAFEVAEKRDQARASAAAAAIDSERRYRLIADNTDDLIALLDRTGRALYLSPSHERVLGVEVSRMLGRSPADFLVFENLQAANEAFRSALERGEGALELQIRRQDGVLRIFDAHMKRVETDEGQLVAMLSRDISERRDLESRLHASERLEALGRLAGSVAHDFNNLLTVIGGASDMIRSALPPEHPALADVDSVLGATDTASELARQLLTFSRKQLVVRTHLALSGVLEAQRDLLVRMVGGHIRLEYEFEEDLPLVLMPRTHIEQLAMNMALNARDAMPSGGRLLFALHRRQLADRDVSDLVAGTYVELDVQDQGTGIPADVVPHIFEPFFSTKGTRGTGLGLATCFGIAAQAGGTIQVQSEVGQGTTFRVLLPAAATLPPPSPTPSVPRDARCVLVVDDDPSVRNMTTRMLRSEGHEVRTAATVAEARQIIEDLAVPLDALLTDVVLGPERGTDLISVCRRARPQARVVIMSGYTPDVGAARLLASGDAAFLPKPFGRDDLLSALRGGQPLLAAPPSPLPPA